MQWIELLRWVFGQAVHGPPKQAPHTAQPKTASEGGFLLAQLLAAHQNPTTTVNGPVRSEHQKTHPSCLFLCFPKAPALRWMSHVLLAALKTEGLETQIVIYIQHGNCFTPGAATYTACAACCTPLRRASHFLSRSDALSMLLSIFCRQYHIIDDISNKVCSY